MAINLLKEHLDTSDVMKDALVLQPQKAADALDRMDKQLFLQGCECGFTKPDRYVGSTCDSCYSASIIYCSDMVIALVACFWLW